MIISTQQVVLYNLKKIYIINNAGLCLASWNDTFIKNKPIFAGYVRALHDLGIETSGKTLSSFTLGKDHFIIYSCESQKLLILGECNSNHHKERALKELQEVSELFCTNYSSILPYFNGDTSHFQDFEMNLIAPSEVENIINVFGIKCSIDNETLLRILYHTKSFQSYKVANINFMSFENKVWVEAKADVLSEL